MMVLPMDDAALTAKEDRQPVRPREEIDLDCGVMRVRAEGENVVKTVGLAFGYGLDLKEPDDWMRLADRLELNGARVRVTAGRGNGLMTPVLAVMVRLARALWKHGYRGGAR